MSNLELHLYYIIVNTKRYVVRDTLENVCDWAAKNQGEHVVIICKECPIIRLQDIEVVID